MREEKQFVGFRDHASVILPSVLQTNIRHRKLDIGSLKNFISSDISAFEQGHCQGCW